MFLPVSSTVATSISALTASLIVSLESVACTGIAVVYSAIASTRGLLVLSLVAASRRAKWGCARPAPPPRRRMQLRFSVFAQSLRGHCEASGGRSPAVAAQERGLRKPDEGQGGAARGAAKLRKAWADCTVSSV